VEPRKGSRTLLEAFARARGRLGDGALLAVAGGETLFDYADYRAGWREDAERLSLSVHDGPGPPDGADVAVLGTIPDDAMPVLYRAADALALPSIDRTEAFGLVLLEALACGTPVVASRLPGVRTLVDDGRTGFLVDPGDPVALATRLAQCLRERDALSPNAVAFVRARYGWDAIASQLLALYQRLLAGAGAEG